MGLRSHHWPIWRRLQYRKMSNMFKYVLPQPSWDDCAWLCMSLLNEAIYSIPWMTLTLVDSFLDFCWWSESKRLPEPLLLPTAARSKPPLLLAPPCNSKCQFQSECSPLHKHGPFKSTYLPHFLSHFHTCGIFWVFAGGPNQIVCPRLCCSQQKRRAIHPCCRLHLHVNQNANFKRYHAIVPDSHPNQSVHPEPFIILSKIKMTQIRSLHSL